MVVTIHQPEHLPWLGFFDKIRRADVFVILDTVQFRKNYFQNRNKIRVADGFAWVTVPVLTKGQGRLAINEVLINNTGNSRWQKKCWTSLKNAYCRSPFWSTYGPIMEELYGNTWNQLADFNEALIHVMLQLLGIEPKLIRSSELKSKGTRSDLLLGICQELGANVYLSGISGREYLDVNKFELAGIEVRFHQFRHPIYKQLYDPFIPAMSTVDLLFNYGTSALQVIQGVGVEVMNEIFE